MRIRSLAKAAALAASLAPAASEAGTLASATWTQNIQGVVITVTSSGATCTDTDPAHYAAAGSIACPTSGIEATGTSTATSYSAGLTLPLFEMQTFTTGGVIAFGTMATLSGPQSIAGNGFSATATQGVQGNVLIGGAFHSMLSMISQPAGGTLVQIPLSVGKAGIFTAVFTILGSYQYLTVDFYGWTPGTLTFSNLTSAGQPLPSVIAMGSFALDANGAGTVTLVSPSKVSIDGATWQRRTASFTTLKLTFVPEPGTAALLGAAALVLLGLRRRS